ncbi:MAG: hypothetical protein LCI00_02815 [Chloroflexi bacterium]|nr:hypothetical protein [Chloroflexota bacterium]MCC6893475.1 hypothetical protein [Anaerolineae bacterium]
MIYLVGIDGGGSTVRVVVTGSDFTILGEATDTTANPNIVGREVALQTIQAAIQRAVAAANLTLEDISAVGIGVAGADSSHSEAWVRAVVQGVLPAAEVAPSSDHEIALVGAHGQRRGILVLAGTGSLASGVGASGEYVLVGGRGYLLGDEGSGYWMGMEAFKTVVRAYDGRAPETSLTALLLAHFNLPDVPAVIPWLYHSGISRNKEIAGFAGTVLQQAEQGDPVSTDIIRRAAEELALSVRALRHHFDMEALPIAFAGGLLTVENPLSLKLCQLLDLPDLPRPQYPPVIGAAILAFSKLGLNFQTR